MKYIDLLNEAQNYEDMFKKIFDTYEKAELDSTDLQYYLKSNLDFAKRTLKKNDRIIWFLRYLKIEMIMNKLNGEIYKNDELFKPLKDDATKTATKGNINISGPILNTYVIQSNLGHFLSLPIPNIQNYIFTNQPFNEVKNQFEQWEQEWIEKTKGLVEPQEGDREIIKFGDGYSWWLLDRGSCDIEAKAMGHCGNVPSEKYGDRILSFRKNVHDNFWEPHLTFILDKNGRIGESKGRGNEKPVKKYHPYIAKLLMNNIINGIKGGGYKPENNFQLSDLDDDLREKVLEVNPDLETNVIILYKKEGLTPRVENMAIENLYKENLEIISMNENETILQEYNDVERFQNDMSTDFKLLNDAIDFYNIKIDNDQSDKIDDAELEELAIELKTIPDDYVDIMQKLPTQYLNKITSSINYTKPITNINQLYDIADLIDKTKYGNILRMAMIDANINNQSDFDNSEFINYINILLQIYTSNSNNYYVYIKPIKNINDTIIVAMPTENVIDIAHAAYLDHLDILSDGDDWLSEEDVITYSDIKYNNNWIPVDSSRLNDDELDWIDGEDKQIFDKYNEIIKSSNVKNINNISQQFDTNIAAKFVMSYIDLNESTINRLKKLAGI
jgi:hypothetical protein